MNKEQIRNQLISAEEITELFQVDKEEADRMVAIVKKHIEWKNGASFNSKVPKKILFDLLRIKYIV